MKVVELLKIGRNLLEVLQNSCIKMNDVKFIQMYDEYKRIEQKNMKVTYAAAMLSKKYGISERQFYYIIKRFETDCKIHAVS